MVRLWLATCLVLCSGCTLLFPSDFADRAVVARGPIYEGMIVTALLESRAGGLDDTTTGDFSFSWVGKDDEWGLPTVRRVSAGSDFVAFELSLPTDLPMLAGETATLKIAADGNDFGRLEVMGLPEAQIAGDFNVAELEPLYTELSLTNVTFDVTEASVGAARIRATHRISLAGEISVAAQGPDGGPGACRGTDCPGWPTAAGAGAGHALDGGLDAADDTLGGPRYGTPTLVPLADEGGSPGASVDGDGTGGQGGGVIELTSLLELSAQPGTVIDASGGSSSDAGGGSGGAILIRFPKGPDLTYRNQGGMRFGSPGRTRFDTGEGSQVLEEEQDLSGGVLARYRGPMWTDIEIDANEPSVRLQEPGTETISIGVSASVSQSGPRFGAVFSAGGEWERVDTIRDLEEGSRRWEIEFPSRPGTLYRVCLLPESVDEVDEDDYFSEKQNCLDVAVP
ncbi:MAG: hypothetical protein KJO07_12045 [Deltaproteobacteria bacterium]|nr:hypothetical protein [Deltaproteobacteria bacterium]